MTDFEVNKLGLGWGQPWNFQLARQALKMVRKKILRLKDKNRNNKSKASLNQVTKAK